MALEDIVYDDQTDQKMILEIPSVSYTGALEDIESKEQSSDDAYVFELKQKPFVNNTIRIR